MTKRHWEVMMTGRKWPRLRSAARDDLWAGVMFLLVGSFAAIYGLFNYRLGTLERMGAGFFPVMVGAVIGVMGLVIMLVSVRKADSEKELTADDNATSGLVELTVVSAAVIVFAILLRNFGLFAAIIGLVAISRIARWGNWKDVVGLAAGLCCISYLIFVVGLGMHLKLVPW